MRKIINFYQPLMLHAFLFFKFFFPVTGFLYFFILNINNPVEGQALPGDIIKDFKVVKILENTSTTDWQWDMNLEVYYTFNPAHREVIIGGELLPYGNEYQSGHNYWGTNSGPMSAVVEENLGSIIEGMQRVNISIKLNVAEKSTTQIRLFMYGKDGNAIVSSTFDYTWMWRMPSFAFLTINSNPTGSKVIVGIKSINMMYSNETGRFVGTAPLTIKLIPNDVSYTGNNANLVCEISKDGYYPSMQIIGLGENGRLEPNKTYKIDVNLTPLR